MAPPLSGKRVAVVGSGITGLSSAWLLHRNGATVTLFEKETSCGGHTLTDTTSPFPIDLGFQVYNLTTYPNLVGFFECLGVDTAPSDMSFALSVDGGKLEWGSHSLDTIFAQRRNLASLSHWAMVADVVRFGREAPRVLDPDATHEYRTMTLCQYLSRHKYSAGFINNYVLPMCAAVWSVPNVQVMEFPVQMLVRFWINHHLLDIFQRPLWRVVKGRSREYVKRVCSELPDVRTSCGIAAVRRAAAGSLAPAVTLVTEAGDEEAFDAVVFATHSDVTLRILGAEATPEEAHVLGAIPYNENDVYLHTDVSLMPVNRKVWASWNFLGSSSTDAAASAVCVSYWANRLQHLPPGAPDMFVTLNPPAPPAADQTFRHLKLAHPVFSFKSWEAQQRVSELQGVRGTFFAGAWCGYGFHEDGIRAAVSAVTAMGGAVPWTCRPTSPKLSLTQQWLMHAFDRFAAGAFKTGYLRIILPNGAELSYGDPEFVHAVPAGEEWRGRAEPRATLRVYNADFFWKVVVRHDTGLGEAYMDGDFEADDLGGLMAVIVANAYGTEDARGALGIANWVGDRLLHLAHRSRANTLEGSRRNIEEHYDAGNAMYKLFLDESMMYSSAMHAPGNTLYEAQMRKLDAIIDAAGISAGDQVLEIGCGWGAFAIRAAQRTGCHVTGLTLSKEQLSEATARVKAAGLSDLISLRFCDYRDCQGEGVYDKVVSIEMIEAVGHENLPTYFSVIGRLLKPGGTAVLQAICCPDERYDAYRHCSDFIREHIFPGGHLPCVGACVEAARGTGLSLRVTTDIGPHYAITLRAWRATWEARKQEALGLGYSDRFWRKYRFYFAYCEAGFDYRYIHNFHLTWVKDQAPAAEQSVGRVRPPSVAATALSASAAALQAELPSDPINQALLAIYFFLAGMLVRGHPFMWILPAVSCACALAAHALHAATAAALPWYLDMPPERQAWWRVDLLHLLYSAAVSAASLVYLASEPRALRLHDQPPEARTASVIVASATGFAAFHLWMCVRYRLFKSTAHAVVQYTTLLVLFGVAVFKAVNLPFLAITQICELASLPFLANKLRRLAGASSASRAGRVLQAAEGVALLSCRVLPHAAITAIVALSPSAFDHSAYHLMALLGMAYMNWENWRRAKTALGLWSHTGIPSADKPSGAKAMAPAAAFQGVINEHAHSE